MNSYFFCCSGSLVRFKGSPVSADFTATLGIISGKVWEAAYMPETRLSIPFDDVLPIGTTFADYIRLVESWLKRPLTSLPTIEPTDQIVMIYNYEERYGICLAEKSWIPLLQTKGFGIKVHKTYEHSEFADGDFLRDWLTFHKHKRWDSAADICRLLEIIQPAAEPHAIPNLASEIEVLRKYTRGLTGAAEQKVFNTFLTGSADVRKKLWALRSVQAILLRNFIKSLAPQQYRTSDLTAAFNTYMQLQIRDFVPLAEVGTLMKALGYKNKRTAAGYVWPELKVAKEHPNQPILKDIDLDVGSAVLFSEL